MAAAWKPRAAALALGLAVVATVALVFGARAPVIVAVEEALFDQYQRILPRPYDPETPVRVIDIDEASLAEMGQWPWPRSYIAEMIERLAGAGAAAIAFDMMFAEPDRTSPERIRQAWARFNQRFGIADEEDEERSVIEMAGLDRLPDNDAILARMMQGAPVVLGTILTTDEGRARPPVKAGVSFQGSDPRAVLARFSGATVNIPRLAAAASGIGSVSLAPGQGDTVRRVPMIAAIGDRLVPALSVEALRVAQGAGSHLLRSTDASGNLAPGAPVAVESLRTGAIVMPLDADGALRVRYAGPRPERIIPAGRLLASAAIDRETAAEVAGRIVLIGSSAPGLRDLVATPLSPVVPGVTVHAEIIEQIVSGITLTRPDWAYGAELAAIVGLGLLVVVLMAFNLPWLALTVTATAFAGLTGLSWWAFETHDLLLSPVAPGLAVGLGYFAVSGVNYVTAERSRREITRQFEHFVSPEVIREIVADPRRHLTPGGARRELTILFLDVRGFSTLSEQMTPEEVITFINRLLTPMTDVILRHEGTIDKYMGDAVMAFWNAPRLTERHEAKAVAATLDLFPALAAVNRDFARLGLPPAGIGVGLNTGDCSVGNMGSTRRLAYSCVGDAVNLASRLEGLTKQYGVKALVGAATAAGAGEAALLPLDRVAVKGRVQPEEVFALAGGADLARSEGFRALAEALAAARAAYVAQDWDAAEAAFARVAACGTVGLVDAAAVAATFRERIEVLRFAPRTPDWDGVFIARSK